MHAFQVLMPSLHPMSFNTMYERAPRWAQSATVAAVGAYLDWQRHGGEFRSLLARAEAATFADPGELARLREQAWNERLRAAVATVGSYDHRDLALQDVPTLPVLTKDAVRAKLAAYANPTVPRWRRVPMHTSGTTGAGLRFWVSLHALRTEYAYVWRYRRAHGIEPGERCATFGGRAIVPPARREPPYWIENPIGRATLYSQYHLNERTVRGYVEHLRDTRVRWIHGYPSFVSLFCRLAIDAGLAGTTQVRWVTLSSENLLDPQRRAIEQMFGVRPRQQYGSTESVAMVSECPEGRLHVDEDYSLVELLPAGDDPGSRRIVGTTLANDAFPLLRYDLADLVREAPAANRCVCGRAGRVLDSIDGREEDFVVLADGSRVGRVDHFFKDAVHVKEAQIVQRRPGAAVVRVVRAPRWSTTDELQLRRSIELRVGGLLEAELEYVDAIPRTRSGKLRLVVSEVDGATLRGSAQRSRSLSGTLVP